MNAPHVSPRLRPLLWIALVTCLLATSLTAAFAASSAAPAAVRGRVFIDRLSAPWQSQQVQEACVLPNPKDPEKLIMFYSGVPAANRRTCFIGKAWALKSDPFTWHQDPANPVFLPAGGEAWDSNSIRLDAVLYIPEEDAYYIYYSGTRSLVQDQIGLAICPAGADGYSDVTPATIRRWGTAPVLAPEPAAPFHEVMSSQAAVLREWNAETKRWDWTMYYSYRGKDGVLPGLRLATSSDGKTWTRQFNANDPRGMGQIFPSIPNAYYEWHQIFKVDDTYVLSIELGIEKGQRWRTALAVSKSPRTGWQPLPPDTVLQTQWTGLYRDDAMYHVATPAFYPIDGRWYLYAQACPLPTNRNYIDGAWDLWVIECARRIPTLPGYADVWVPGVPDAAR